MSMSRVAIIGAGVGGMSAAARLAAAGYTVDVYDHNVIPGGKAGSESYGEYRFDTGPSLVTMPHVFEQLFEETGEYLHDYVELIPLRDVCRYFFSDGTRLVSSNDREEFAGRIAAVTHDPPRALHRFLDYSKRIYRITAELFLWKSLHEARTYLNMNTLRSLLSIGGIDPFRTMDEAVRSYFSDPRMIQFFNRSATYNGSNPYQTPATLNIIPHVEYDIGAAAPARGVFSIPLAMMKLAQQKGATFHLGTGVDRILYESRSRRIRGVSVGGVESAHDVVISNVDVVKTYSDLLDDKDAPLLKRYERLEPSSSGMVFYFGMDGTFPELGLHNIFFSPDYHAEFDDIFEKRKCPEDPTVYINITSKVNPADAPPDGENWFVLVNAPYDSGQDWETGRNRIRDAVIRRVSHALGYEIADSIAVEASMSPPEIERKTSSRFGSLYGISSNSRAAAFLRHPNRSRRYPALYFCGGSAHPGGGMPLAVLSGKIVSDIVQRRDGVKNEHRSEYRPGKITTVPRRARKRAGNRRAQKR